MIKLTLLALSAALLVGCSSSDGGSSTPGGSPGTPEVPGTPGTPDQDPVPPVGDIVGEARVNILGDWSITPEGAQCSSVVTFGSDGSYLSAELDERITGEYVIDEDDDGLFVAIEFLTDNQLPDCNGSTESDAGEGLSSFLMFPSDDAMVLSSEPAGEGNVLEFVRNN